MEMRSAPVLVGTAPARFGNSVWDAVGSTGRRGLFYDEQVVFAKEVSGVLHLAQPKGEEKLCQLCLPFGRAAPSQPGSEEHWGVSVMCPVADLARQGHTGTAALLPSRSDFVKLAVVVVVRDPDGHVLLTRRAQHMRTFPNCWVFPGGGVDEGETLRTAACRELEEETGIKVSIDSLKLLCIWESVFPTSSEACLEMGQVKGHAVTVFVEALLDDQPEVKLQVAECGAYVWVPLKDLIHWHSRDRPPDKTLAWMVLPGKCLGETESLESCKISAIELHGIYPTFMGAGIGQGHLFAIAKLAERDERASL